MVFLILFYLKTTRSLERLVFTHFKHFTLKSESLVKLFFRFYSKSKTNSHFWNHLEFVKYRLQPKDLVNYLEIIIS